MLAVTVALTACLLESPSGTEGSSPQVASMAVQPSQASLALGDTLRLVAEPRDSGGHPIEGLVVEWSTDDPLIAEVDSTGLVTAVGEGVTAIVATAGSTSGRAEIQVHARLEGWPNEPPGLTTYSDWSWDDLDNCPRFIGGWCNIHPEDLEEGRIGIVQDSSGPYSSDRVLQFFWPEGHFRVNGERTETARLYTPIQGGPREIYMAYWWKASEPLHMSANCVNKVNFVVMNGGFFVLAFEDGDPCDKVSDFAYFFVVLVFPTDNSHLPNGLGGAGGGTRRVNGNVNPGRRFRLGEWHLIEVHAKYSTGSSSKDGILRWWVDGVLIGDYREVNFPETDGDGNPSAFIEAQFAPSWGTGDQTKVKDDYFWIDHVRISGR